MTQITFMDDLTCLTVVVDKHLGIQMMELFVLPLVPLVSLVPLVVQSKPKRQFKKPEVEVVEVVEVEVVESYTANEALALSDADLLSEFQRITGHSHLYCSHCRRESPLYERWVHAIRKRCGKRGISQDMWIPGTCDRQLKTNEVCNDANNAAYRVLQKIPHSSELAQRVSETRRNALQTLGIHTKK